MEKIWLKIIQNKSNPFYWPASIILWLASILYRRGLWIHSLKAVASVKTKAPVISVGNLTVGGSGKTPVTIELARHFINLGLKTAIVSSGYGRNSKDDVLVTGEELQNLEIEKTGDEPRLMAEILPSAIFAISHSKSNGATLVDRNYSPDIIIIDDGFQHRNLHRDFDLLVADSTTDLRRESIFPLGRRREPLSAINRADGLVITNMSLNAIDVQYISWLDEKFKNKPLATLSFRNDEIISGKAHIPLDKIRKRRLCLFAGIGNFPSFENHIRLIFPNAVSIRQFPDHCRYSHSDLNSIKDDLARANPEYLITTLKDYVKVRNFDFGQPLYYLNLRLDFDPAAKRLFDELEKKIKK